MNQLNFVKVQLKNELNAYNNERNIVSEIKGSNSKVISSLADNREIPKDIIKTCNKTEGRNYEMKNELLKLKMALYGYIEIDVALP